MTSDSQSLGHLIGVKKDGSAEDAMSSSHFITYKGDLIGKAAAASESPSAGSPPTQYWCADLYSECFEGERVGHFFVNDAPGREDSAWWVDSIEGLRKSLDKTIDGFECCPRRPMAADGRAFPQAF